MKHSKFLINLSGVILGLLLIVYFDVVREAMIALRDGHEHEHTQSNLPQGILLIMTNTIIIFCGKSNI
jgi:hypothetical protein